MSTVFRDSKEENPDYPQNAKGSTPKGAAQFNNLTNEGGAQGGGPGLAGIQDGCRGFFLPLGAAVLGAGQAVPGFDADELGHTGLAPDQGIGETGKITHHRAASALFIDTQSLGIQVGHAMAIVGKELLIHGNSGNILSQIVMILLQQASVERLDTFPESFESLG